MRCHRHPEQIADTPCGICGRYHCADCLTSLDGEPVCPACRPAVEAATPAGRMDAEAPARESGGMRWGRLAGGAVLVLAVLALLVVLAQRRSTWDGGVRVVPALAQGEFDERMAAAVLALERAAIALETFRAEGGRYASGWDDLVPDLIPEPPTDPWAANDAPLRLLAPPWDEAAILLYSVGPDGVDDGGRAYAADTGVGDVVYVVR